MQLTSCNLTAEIKAYARELRCYGDTQQESRTCTRNLPSKNESVTVFKAMLDEYHKAFVSEVEFIKT